MRLISKLVGAIAALLPAAATAGVTTPEYILARAPEGSTLSNVFDWTPAGSELQVVDPVVFPESYNSSWITIPDKAAQAQMLLTGPPYHEPMAAFVTFSDNTPVCSRSVGLLGVDGGMGAFTTAKVQQSIKAYLATLPEGWSLYDGLLSDQSEDGRNDLTIFHLPDGVEFPGFFTGGDGGFSVVALFDGADATVSVVITFNRTADSSLVPPTCAA
ncbi:hypothetical protein [uncultured Sulfitobacter sp.]|uniref:hypothetical protein n=1 Tax=uncultured Sulfitobacter sp. TaxID=191468 RepID=UPI002625D598|nr:hypothetical protein [uncultured Sulfitobacter sp.]